MKNAHFYKLLFIIAGIWNLAAGIICWLGSVLIPDPFFKIFGMPLPSSMFPFHAMFWCIIAFGIGFIMVGNNISKNHGIIFIGVIAKILFFIDCAMAVISKEANFMLIGTGIIDLIFALLFIEFLLKVKKVTGQPSH